MVISRMTEQVSCGMLHYLLTQIFYFLVDEPGKGTKVQYPIPDEMYDKLSLSLQDLEDFSTVRGFWNKW